MKIEGSWILALNFERFLLHQESQILISATDQGLEFLARSRNLLCDGTFKTAPTLQKNLYPVWGHNGVESASCLGIHWVKKWFLSNKCTEILKLPLVPEFIVTDYESGVIPAVRIVFFGLEQVAGFTM